MNVVTPPLIGLSDAPLVVDVDGTLIRTDLLHESAMQFIARHPLQAPRLVLWLTQGKAALKRHLAEAVGPDIATLPLRAETLALVRKAQDDGREVYLASASDRSLVEKLAERIGGIEGVFATDGATNLAGGSKAEVLADAFGSKGFDYIGDRPIDFPVWDQARHALAVCQSRSFERSVRRRFPDAEIVARSPTNARDILRAMRPHQWVKNVLLFLPLVSGHHFDSPSVLITFLGFVCFCMAASSAYILNDLLDLPADRAHPRKCRRPFAAGDVGIITGATISAILFVAAGLLALVVGTSFAALLGLYVVSTLGYSLVLKRKLFIDVIALGGLYTIRVMAGLEASQAAQSEWLLMVCLFLFMSLATVKRCSELVMHRDAGRSVTLGRGYRIGDLPVLMSLAAAAGYGTSMILALYISSVEVVRLYSHPALLWLIQPLFLYWISRILLMANRGEIHEDPVIFACTDRISLLTGLCVLAVLLAAL